MARQQFYRPNRRPSRDDGMYDDAPADLPSHKLDTPASDDAADTADKIDDVLAENEAARKSFTPDELGEAETGAPAASPASTESDQSESDKLADDNQLGEGYKEEGKRKVQGKFWTRRRKIIGVGAAGVGIGGVIGIFSIVQGPFQLLQLGETLKKHGWAGEQTASIRLRANFRALRSGQIGETRVSAIGSRIHASTVRRLADIGITIDESNGFGQPTRYRIEPGKHPDLRGTPDAQMPRAIAEYFDVPETDVHRFPGLVEGGRYTFEAGNMKITRLRLLDHTALGGLRNGKIVTAIKFRNLARWHNIPSLFHPIKRLESGVERGIDQRIDDRTRRRQIEENRRKSRKGPVREKFANAKNRINGAIGGKPTLFLATGLLGTEGACIIRKVADAIPIINYGYVVAPSALEAADIISSSDQLKSGQDFRLDQAGARLASLKDENGRSVWESKSLNALATGSEGKGEDIDKGLKQAFTPVSSDEILSQLPLVGNASGIISNFTDLACTELGLAIQGAIGISLTVLSAGTWTFGKVAVAAGHAVVVSAMIQNLTARAIDHLTEDPIKAFSGPVGGSLIAHGSRAAFNSAEMGTGGIPLDKNEELALLQEQQEQELKEFQQKSWLARTFDLNDYRSVASNLARSIDPEPSNLLSSVAKSLTNIPKLFSRLFGVLTPKSEAQGLLYDWGFAKIGIPRSVIQNPKYQDFADNAAQAAQLFSSSSKYIDKAKTCFGVNIQRGTEGWDAVSIAGEDPTERIYEQAYKNAGCDDLSDESWIRTILFVYDTSLFTAVDCYDGGEPSCQQLGFGSAPGVPTNAPTGPKIVGDPYTDTSSIPCAPGTTDLNRIEDGYSDGSPFKVRLCSIPSLPDLFGGFAIVNSRVSGAWFALGNAAKTAGIDITVYDSFRTMAEQESLWAQNPNSRLVARPGYSSHQAGVAIDFYNISGKDPNAQSCDKNVRVRDPSSPTWQWLYTNAERYGFKQYSAEAWHWDALPLSNRCTSDPEPQ